MATQDEDFERMDMSPGTARKLYETGATMMISNFPRGSVFGIDMKVYYTDVNFHGVKMIPPGFHYVYSNAVSSDGTTGPRSGFFHYFKKRELLLKRWSHQEEEITDDPDTDELRKERLRNNLRSLDQHFGAYPYQELKTWNRLTCNISEALLERLQPLSAVVRSVVQLIPLPHPREVSEVSIKEEEDEEEMEEGTPSRRHQTLEEKFLPNMKQLPGTEIRFTKIPEKKYPDGCSAEEITRHSMDSTYVLETLLKTYDKEEDILGEFQLALISFLVAHVYDAFEHWKHLLDVFCHVDSGIVKHSQLLKTFLTILHYQIKEIPTDFFTDITSEDNVLVDSLQIFFDNVNNSSAPAGFKAFSRKFQENLTKTYKWDFEHVRDDEMPVVVEIPIFQEE